MKQTVLITGAGGQLGQELLRTAADEVECVALSRAQLDISDSAAVSAIVRELSPQAIINAAAYTAVDRAESESDLAAQINTRGAENLARAARDQGSRLLHVSTDFVFDGNSSVPYGTDAIPSPVSAYGIGKRDGESAVQAVLPEALIVRTGWVYSKFGGNFVKTMLRLMAEREELGVVVDQVGTPTWARGLACLLWSAVAGGEQQGIYHWSDAGVCSWYDFAVAIGEDACEIGLLDRTISIRPIAGASYPTPASRPAYSVLDKASTWRDFDIEPVHWRVQLRCMLQELKESLDE